MEQLKIAKASPNKRVKIGAPEGSGDTADTTVAPDMGSSQRHWTSQDKMLWSEPDQKTWSRLWDQISD